MGIPDKTGKKVYKGPQHKNAECADDSMEFNTAAALKSAGRISSSNEVQEDYSIEGKQMPRSRK